MSLSSKVIVIDTRSTFCEKQLSLKLCADWMQLPCLLAVLELVGWYRCRVPLSVCICMILCSLLSLLHFLTYVGLDTCAMLSSLNSVLATITAATVMLVLDILMQLLITFTWLDIEMTSQKIYSICVSSLWQASDLQLQTVFKSNLGYFEFIFEVWNSGKQGIGYGGYSAIVYTIFLCSY